MRRPASLCEQTTPTGLCIMITTGGGGSTGLPITVMRAGRSGPMAMRAPASVRATPSNST